MLILRSSANATTPARGQKAEESKTTNNADEDGNTSRETKASGISRGRRDQVSIKVLLPELITNNACTLQNDKMQAAANALSPLLNSPTRHNGGGQFKPIMPRPAGMGAARQPLSGMRSTGKWANHQQKELIAQYTSKFGATAASRRFNVPTSVASYYHRKVYGRPLPKGRKPMCDESLMAAQP